MTRSTLSLVYYDEDKLRIGDTLFTKYEVFVPDYNEEKFFTLLINILQTESTANIATVPEPIKVTSTIKKGHL